MDSKAGVYSWELLREARMRRPNNQCSGQEFDTGLEEVMSHELLAESIRIAGSHAVTSDASP